MNFFSIYPFYALFPLHPHNHHTIVYVPWVLSFFYIIKNELLSLRDGKIKEIYIITKFKVSSPILNAINSFGCPKI